MELNGGKGLEGTHCFSPGRGWEEKRSGFWENVPTEQWLDGLW